MTVEGMTSGCSAHLSFLRHCGPCESGGLRVSVGEVSLLALGNSYAGRGHADAFGVGIDRREPPSLGCCSHSYDLRK